MEYISRLFNFSSLVKKQEDINKKIKLCFLSCSAGRTAIFEKYFYGYYPQPPSLIGSRFEKKQLKDDITVIYMESLINTVFCVRY